MVPSGRLDSATDIVAQQLAIAVVDSVGLVAKIHSASAACVERDCVQWMFAVVLAVLVEADCSEPAPVAVVVAQFAAKRRAA